MLEGYTHEPHPQVYSVKTVEVPKPPEVVFTMVPRTQYFVPTEARKSIMAMFDRLRATPNPNRGRLSGTALSLTFGAQTGRGSDRSCVIQAHPRSSVPRVDFARSPIGTECRRCCATVLGDPNLET